MSSWLKLSPDKFLVNDNDSQTKLYRIIPFDSLLQILNEGFIYLVKTSKWDDVYENFFLKETFIVDGIETDFTPVINRFFGQCWTSRQSSDSMWRIYSSDQKSVMIKTTVGKIDAIVPKDNIKELYLLGRVRYFSRKQIEGELRDNHKVKLMDVYDYMLKSLFVKRDSFKHESEYRLICMCEVSSPHYNNSIIPLRVNPYEFIENIFFDPRADKSYIERCKKTLVKAFNFPADRIKKSTLYEFRPSRIEII